MPQDTDLEILLWFVSEDVLPVFSYRNFMSCLIFRSLSHFEFIILYVVRECSSIIDLPLAVQLSQRHWLKWSGSCSIVSDSLWLHGPCSLSNSPGQNTGVGSLSLLQGIFPKPGIEPRSPPLHADSCWRDCFFSIVYSYLLCQTLINCRCVGLFLGSFFYSIDLFVFVPVPYCFDCCKLCSLKSGRIMPQALFFFPQNCFGNFGPLMVSYKF